MMKIHRILLLILLMPVCGTILGNGGIEVQNYRNDPYTRFTSFTQYIGDECGTIVDIFQDRHGYIWLAGTSCLARFDGNNVRKYINDWTPGSLTSSHVTCIAADKSGRLLVGTSKGVCLYDYSTDKFTPIFEIDTASVNNDSLYVQALLPDGDSLLWMETLNGLLWKIDLQSFTVLNQFHHKRTDQPYYHYHTIYRDNDNTLWIGGRGIGPSFLDEEKGLVVTIPCSNHSFIPGMKREYDVAYYYTDSNGSFWVGGLDGAYLFNKQDTSFHQVIKSSSWAMTESSQGDLWFGTGNGLARVNQNNWEVTYNIHNEEDIGSLPGNNIHKIYEDRYGQMWISTSQGVAIYKPESVGVEYLFHVPGTNNTLASSSITDLCEGEDGIVWISTTQKGIDKYDPVSNSIKHFNTKNTQGLPSNKIKCIEMAKDGSIYCGLWAGLGFGRLFPERNHFSLYTYNSKSTHFDWYNDMAFDKTGRLYLGFWGGPGLTLFDTARGAFATGLKDKFRLTNMSRLITCLHFDSQNRLWMGTTQTGLHLYLPEKDTSICYYTKVNPQEGIDQKKIYDIEESSNGNIWIGAKGLFYNISGEKTINEVSFDQLGMKHEVFAILPIGEKDVWLATSYGVIRYSLQWERFYDYSNIINITFNESNACAIELADKRIMFGGENGIAIIKLDELRTNVKKPMVYLSSLSVFDKVKIPSFYGKKDVVLAYNENFFSINIGSDVWGTDIPYKFYYKLDGFDQRWNQIKGNELTARFTNVPPGKYDFQLRVVDDQGEKIDEFLACRLSITPPFWMRWWFISFVIFAVFSFVLFLWRSRYKRMRMSLTNIELNQKLLRLQMNPHFIFNSLFAIQNYIYSNQTHLAGNYLSDFASLIRLILDNSRHEFISMEKEIECIELYLKMQQLRFNDSFSYKIDVDLELEDSEYQIPPMLAQPFLENAIEHGLKNIDYEGEIQVSYQLIGNSISFMVFDNGIGLTASKKVNKVKKKSHESLAISICKKRLEILRKKGMPKISFAINEMKNEDGIVFGTKVMFNIPFNIN